MSPSDSAQYVLHWNGASSLAQAGREPAGFTYKTSVWGRQRNKQGGFYHRPLYPYSCTNGACVEKLTTNTHINLPFWHIIKELRLRERVVLLNLWIFQALFSNNCPDKKKTQVWLALICDTDDEIVSPTLGTWLSRWNFRTVLQVQCEGQVCMYNCSPSFSLWCTAI